MQRILVAIFAVTTVVGAWFAYQFHDQLNARNAQVATLTAERDTARADGKKALAEQDAMKDNIERLTRERDRLLAQAKEQRQPDFPPGGPPGFGGPGGNGPNLGGIAAMLQTPEGKKMFRNQSANIVKSRYADLVKKLKLSPQDSNIVLNLLTDRHAALASARMSGNDAAQIAEQTSAIESEFNDKLKSALGDDGLSQLDNYDKSVEERSQVTQLEDQFSSAGTPLDATQKESLISLMQSEREKSPANPIDPTKTDPGTVLNLLKDDNTMVTWEKNQKDYQDRVISAASKTLTPDQVSTLKQSMDQNLDRSKGALQMFKTTGVPPPPPPK